MEETSQSQNTIKIGVTITESDVFETEDLPEDDQQLVSDYINNSAKENHKSENIESSRIDASEAFKAFADKSLDSEHVDFSDNIATTRIGYPMTKLDAAKKETLAEKYARLEKAIKDLEQEVNIVKDQGVGEGDKPLSSTVMMQKLNFLQRELSTVGMKDDIHASDPQNFYHRKLLNDVNLFVSSSSSSSPSSTSSSATPKDAIKYHMYCSPGHNLHADDAAIEDLEQRIARCENVVGLDSDKPGGFLTGETPNKTLLGALSLVVAKFALLDLTQLTHFESSLLAIHQKQLQALSKSEASDIADKVDKVSNMYDAIKKADPTMEKLPEISDRLKNLFEEHESATQFSRTLAHVDSSQKQLMEHLIGHTEQLKQIQAILGPQMALFDANCKTLEELS